MSESSYVSSSESSDSGSSSRSMSSVSDSSSAGDYESRGTAGSKGKCASVVGCKVGIVSAVAGGSDSENIATRESVGTYGVGADVSVVYCVSSGAVYGMSGA